MEISSIKVSTKTIRKANKVLLDSGVSSNVKNNYDGFIIAHTVLNGVVKSRIITKEKINEAFGDSLKKYAEKI
jgi:hypothetical protein